MSDAIIFKILQRQNKFRNPKGLLSVPPGFGFDREDYRAAEMYLARLQKLKINCTFPGDSHYPIAFLRMQEPPLFLEYIGEPVWKTNSLFSLVGSRKIHQLSTDWMKTEIAELLRSSPFRVVSGGAIGVDLLSHSISVLENKPTVAIIPSGLSNIYPSPLQRMVPALLSAGGVVLTEFELEQTPHRNYFFYRNRLIAALGMATLVVQSQDRSGTLLTVHHCLQNGRPVLVVPTHPSIKDFTGNLSLLQDGATPVYSQADLRLYLQTENQFGA